MKTLKTQDFLRNCGLDALCTGFGIKATRHAEFPNLVLFKYDQLKSPMAHPVVQECRGLILDESNDWDVVCHPFDKFFNAGEGNAAPIDWNTARVFEKLDGSLMSLYFYEGEWRVSSSGRPDAGGSMGNLSQTMAECFWLTWHGLGYEMPWDSLRDWTFMFEFMTPWNRVVVMHEKPRIVLIGKRTGQGDTLFPGEESPIYELSPFNWEKVKSFPLNSLDGVLDAAKHLKPLECEGYVVCDANYNRVKVKSPSYVALHHMRDSFSERRIVELIQNGEGEEFLAYFPDFEAQYREVKAGFDSLVNSTETIWLSMPTYSPSEQKQFALAAKDLPCSAALFALRAGKVASSRDFYNAMAPDKVLKVLGAPTL